MQIIEVHRKPYPIEIDKLRVGVGHFPQEFVVITTVLLRLIRPGYSFVGIQAIAGVGSTKFVTENGEKLSFNEAKAIFPTITKEEYIND